MLLAELFERSRYRGQLRSSSKNCRDKMVRFRSDLARESRGAPRGVLPMSSPSDYR